MRATVSQLMKKNASVDTTCHVAAKEASVRLAEGKAASYLPLCTRTGYNASKRREREMLRALVFIESSKLFAL